jgi:hypothetical protein
MVLRMTIWDAKREWVDRLIDDPDVSIWDLVKWCKGRHLKEIPLIMTNEGLTHDPDIMSSCFCSRFFDILCDARLPPSLLHSRNLPTHPLALIREDKIRDTL